MIAWKKVNLQIFRFSKYKENCGSVHRKAHSKKKIWLVSHGNFCFYIKLRKLYKIQFGLM